ncbi:MAG: hypothetical protein Q9210_000984 [Variospora velana]
MSSGTSAATSARTSPNARWTKEDDAMLKMARASELQWQSISKTVIPMKAPRAFRRRHEKPMEKYWGESKIHDLASKYDIVRKEMWRLLADELGEPWELVETKHLRTEWLMKQGEWEFLAMEDSCVELKRGLGRGKGVWGEVVITYSQLSMRLRDVILALHEAVCSRYKPYDRGQHAANSTREIVSKQGKESVSFYRCLDLGSIYNAL